MALALVSIIFSWLLVRMRVAASQRETWKVMPRAGVLFSSVSLMLASVLLGAGAVAFALPVSHTGRMIQVAGIYAALCYIVGMAIFGSWAALRLNQRSRGRA
ncbi:MAG TPA: hypothetical protein VHW65_09315 [Gemmatimonadales bacterium]|jgi:peptidoglycan biosynthesis protein MviN/MurJ (putative lipid II flippase)|nr:hypothetical protein [Gemmatimonadales bacterium]